MRKRSLLVFIFTMVLAVFLVACTANPDAGEEKDNNNANGNDNNTEANDGNDLGADGEKVLRVNNGEEPTSLNPSIGFDELSWDPLNNLMEGLTRLQEDHTPGPGVATDWDISDDGTMYTFDLNEDAKWSNGDPVVAGDFEFAWKYMLDPETASEAAFLGYFIKGAEEYNGGEGDADDVMVTAEDDHTLVVELNAPTGFFLDLLTNPAFFPINEAVATENDKWHAEADSFVGNGPFALEEWKHDDEMLFAKNEHYWDADAVNLDKVHFAMVNDSNTQYQMFTSGDLDTASIPPELSDELIDGDDVYIGEQGGLEFFRFNLTKEPFQNKKIRQAFAYAINRDDIAEFVVKNGVEPANGFINPGFIDPDGNDFRETNGDLISFDPDQAKELLAEGMEEEGYDELPDITLNYNTSDTNKVVAEAVQDMLKENLDIEPTLENQEWGVYADAQIDLELHFSRSSFINDYNDPVNFLESFITDSYMNRTGFESDEYDALIEKGKYATDEKERWDALYEAEELLAEEMVAMPLRFYNTVALEADGVSGILRHPVGYFDLKFADVE